MNEIINTVNPPSQIVMGDISMPPSIREITKALNKIQGAMKPALKDSINPYFESKYADLESVWLALREPLAQNGFAIIQIPGGDGDNITLTTFLAHESGEWIKGTAVARPSKNDPQGAGSCLSYLRRYSLSAFVGGYSADDDANLATQPPITKQDTKRTEPKKTESILPLPKGSADILKALEEKKLVQVSNYSGKTFLWVKPIENLWEYKDLLDIGLFEGKKKGNYFCILDGTTMHMAEKLMDIYEASL